MIISIPNYIYTAKFSTLQSAFLTYITTLTAITQTLLVEVAETTMQAGYDRADWFYEVLAECHYSDLPEAERTYDDYALVVAQSTALATIPAERSEVEPDYIDAEYWVTPVLPTFEPIALLCAWVDFTDRLRSAFTEWNVKELKAECKARKLKGYTKYPKAALVELLLTTNY